MKGDRGKNSIIVISLVFLMIVMGLTFGGRERISRFENFIGQSLIPVQKTFNTMTGLLESLVSPVINIWDNEKRIAELERDNASLREALVSSALEANEYEELKELRGIFDYLPASSTSLVTEARVVSKDPGNWYNMFVIDKGYADGVKKNSVVISGRGLLGLVYEVSDNFAKVVAIIDHKNSVGIKIADSNRDYEGIVDGGIDGSLKGSFFDPSAKVYPGDLIITSGKGLYQEGILIGTVSEVFKDRNELLVTFTVEPLADFRKLNRVLVLPAKPDMGEVR
ncbi:MAG: hypothetical protein AVO33_08750 [delta proteobacterium ML8_F1]|nr:MAG: hypothetical protein AVO33_08750 [delta proteobacterium ML8_F1]